MKLIMTLVLFISLASCHTKTRKDVKASKEVWGELGPRKISVHGHRGARAKFPENTLPAFEYAASVGVDVLEMDLGITRDNKVVVSHDQLINDLCITPKGGYSYFGKPIFSLTLKQIKELDCGSIKNPRFDSQQTKPGTPMATLAEVFKKFRKSNLEFNIETKIRADKPENTTTPEQFAKLVYQEIKKFPGLEKRVMLQSFDWRTLKAMHDLNPNIRLVALQEDNISDMVEKVLALKLPIFAYSPEGRLLTPELVKKMHASIPGVKVVPWTLNKSEHWETAIQMGVDGIISDDPGALISWLKQLPK